MDEPTDRDAKEIYIVGDGYAVHTGRVSSVVSAPLRQQEIRPASSAGESAADFFHSLLF